MATKTKKGTDKVPHALSKAALQKAHAPGQKLPTAADAAANNKDLPGVAAKALQQPPASTADAAGVAKTAVDRAPGTSTGTGTSRGAAAGKEAPPPRVSPLSGAMSDSPAPEAPSAALALPSPSAASPSAAEATPATPLSSTIGPSAAAAAPSGAVKGLGVRLKAEQDAGIPPAAPSATAVGRVPPTTPGAVVSSVEPPPIPATDLPPRMPAAPSVSPTLSAPPSAPAPPSASAATPASSSHIPGSSVLGAGALGAFNAQRPPPLAGSMPASGAAVPTFGRAPSPPGDSKRWLLHSALPLDVRLVGGLAAASAASYWYFSQRQGVEGASRQLTPESERDLDALEHDRATPDSQTVVQPDSLQPSEGGADTLQQHRGEVVEEESPHSTEAELWSTLHPEAASAADGDGSNAGVGPSTESMEEPEIGDSTPIIDFFHDALIGSAPQSAEVEEDQTADAPPADHQTPGVAATGDLHATEVIEKVQMEKAPAEEVPSVPFAALALAIKGADGSSSDTAEESSGEPDREGAQADAAAIAAAASRGDPDEGVHHTTLGIGQELGASALVRRAIERGEGAGDDWEEYRHRLAQASSDARTFAEALQSAEDFHQSEVARLEAEIGALELMGHASAESAQRQAADQRQEMHAQAASAEMKRSADLQLQAIQLAAAAAEAAVQERCDRIRDLDNVRLRLGALGRAFSRRSEQTRVSHEAHQIALATFSLTDALSTGAPFEVELEQLAAGGREDPLVQAALRSLPAALARQGLPTEWQLRARFQDAAWAARSLGALPEGRLGPLSVGLSKLAAHLKVDERSTVKAGVALDYAGVSPSTALANAEAYLARGDLVAAADALQHSVAGTAAAPAVVEWVQAARARAAADQAVRLLHAHSMALCASLS